MSMVKYIGRKTDFKGKTLWELVGNLKNFGVGRIIVRSMFERYPEACFMKILKVESVPIFQEENARKAKVTVEKTFRGRTYPNPVTIFSASYKADYKLIPKEEESEYCKVKLQIKEQVLPTKIDLPPLLREFVAEETNEKNPMIKLHFKPSRDKVARLAKETETPTIQLTIGLGDPVTTSLFKSVI